MNFLKPICDAYGAWLIYEIDDAMHYNEIPLYNRGRAAFENDQTQDNIKMMLNAADLVIVTTKHIKEYYNTKYGVPIDNILAVPNMLPRWWFGDKFDIYQIMNNRTANKSKPRIGIVSSLSHYNFENFRKTKDGKTAKFDVQTKKWKTTAGEEVLEENTEKINDDIDEIADVIESTVRDFTWVFLGYCPPRFYELAKQRKIEVHGTTSILNYPNTLKQLKLQAIIAPLIQSEFNFCKSPIKYLECCALGIPLLATRCLPYTNVMQDSMLFSNNEELKEKLFKLKFASNGIYKDHVEANFNWFNSEHEDGDFRLKNYWLDDNIGIWYDLFRLRKKTCHISFSNFRKQYEEKLESMKKQTTIYSKNGVEILT